MPLPDTACFLHVLQCMLSYQIIQEPPSPSIATAAANFMNMRNSVVYIVIQNSGLIYAPVNCNQGREGREHAVFVPLCVKKNGPGPVRLCATNSPH